MRCCYEVIEFTYERTLLKQGNGPDGAPLFREEFIGTSQTMTKYAHSVDVATALIRKWNDQYWSYRLIECKRAVPPKGSKVLLNVHEDFVEFGQK